MSRGFHMTDIEYKTRSVGSEFNGQEPPSFKGGEGRKRKKRSWNISDEEATPGAESGLRQQVSEGKDSLETKTVRGQQVSGGKDSLETKTVLGQQVSEGKDSLETKTVLGQQVSGGKNSLETKTVLGHVKDSLSAGEKRWDEIEATVFVMKLRKTRKDLILFLFDKINDYNILSTSVIEVEDVIKKLNIKESNYKRTAGRLAEQNCFCRTGLTAGGTIYTFSPEIFRALQRLRSRL